MQMLTRYSGRSVVWRRTENSFDTPKISMKLEMAIAALPREPRRRLSCAWRHMLRRDVDKLAEPERP
jgi:Holliday junction resolvase RusA-like endonuclease